MKILGHAAVAAALVLAAAPANAIVIRHDRDDRSFRELGAQFPASAHVLPDGSGVLVGPRWVLTAAHVARGVAERRPRVAIGGRSYEVARIFLNPEWRGSTHDVALLKLGQPVPDITPVKLYDRDDEVGQQVTFVGRGDFGTGLTGPTLKDEVQRAATNVVVDADADWIYFVFDAPGESATELEGVSGPGDSGGPALVTRDGTLYTIGVSSFSDGKEPGRYGVREGYARVSTHRTWIDEVLAGKRDAEGFAPVRDTRAGPGGGGTTLPPTEPLPDTAAGRLILDYVRAYNSDDGTEMEAFANRHFGKSLLEEATPEQRRDRYRRLRDVHLGAIELRGVMGVDASGIRVLFESAEGTLAEFRFRVTGDEEPLIIDLQVAVVRIAKD